MVTRKVFGGCEGSRRLGRPILHNATPRMPWRRSFREIIVSSRDIVMLTNDVNLPFIHSLINHLGCISITSDISFKPSGKTLSPHSDVIQRTLWLQHTQQFANPVHDAFLAVPRLDQSHHPDERTYTHIDHNNSPSASGRPAAKPGTFSIARLPPGSPADRQGGTRAEGKNAQLPRKLMLADQGHLIANADQSIDRLSHRALRASSSSRRWETALSPTCTRLSTGLVDRRWLVGSLVVDLPRITR